MINDIIEKYWKDVVGVCIWDWLGIKQVTWSQQKKTKISQKHIYKIYNHIGIDTNVDYSNKEICKIIINKYYNVINNT